MKSFTSELIAPCGMNCSICIAYLREKNKCLGCRAVNKWKPVTRVRCRIKNCEHFPKLAKFCYKCKLFPCDKIKHIDKRYRTKYHMSMIENLTMIKKEGIKKFLEKDKKKWNCKNCGGVICCHNGLCYNCQKDIIRSRKNSMGWESDRR
jgi:hypothetical protein